LTVRRRHPTADDFADAAVIDWLRDVIADRVLALADDAAEDQRSEGRAARATAAAELHRLDRLLRGWLDSMPPESVEGYDAEDREGAL
jgi:hypothetical protein